MMTGQQHLRYFHALIFRGLGILRIFQRVLGKGLFQRGLMGSQNSGNEPDHCVNEGQGCHFTTSQDEIPQRNFFIDDRVDALINSFVVTAQERKTLQLGQLPGFFLSKRLAAGSQKDHRPWIFFLHCLDAIHDRLAGQHHAKATAVGRVIHSAMPVGAVVPDVVRVQGVKAGCSGPAQNAVLQHLKHFREQGQDINPHSSIPWPDESPSHRLPDPRW